ncbi:M56 family metallopeptidase [Robertkochia flava]|uniref:M56 family metallopeptidase n=1 Tax=Robertkochia flava TaxID=3447986 RepID=UPI001CCA2957|nr:M56 family metallopeptidase [Robertkochia marina]
MNYSDFFSYIIKASGLLLLFWGLYKTVLSKETFFNHNRWYLLAGVMVSALMPLWVIERIEIIEIAVSALPAESASPTVASTPEASGFSSEALLFYIYICGVLFFSIKLMIQLLSLRRLLRKGKVRKLKGLCLVSSREISAPFSFFHFIVLPQNEIEAEEQSTILAHEFIHVRQMHSVDIMLMHVLTVLMWINPVAWLYRRDVAQNLEYLADKEASTKKVSSRAYQYILLKQHLNTNQLSIINPFINSLIKKRIVMLQKCPSRKTNLWKLGITIPMLTAFALLFNVKTIAQYHLTETASGPNASSIPLHMEAQEALDVMLYNKMDDAQLKSVQDAVANKGGELKLRKLKRNAQGVITNLEVKFSYENSNASASYSNPEGIESIYIGVKAGGDIYLSTEKDIQANHEFVWVSDDEDSDAYTQVQKEVIVITSNDSIGKGQGAQRVFIKEGNNDVVWTTQSDSSTAKKFIILEETVKGEMNEDGKLEKTIKVVMRENDENVLHIKGDSSKAKKILIKEIDQTDSGKNNTHVQVITTDGKKPVMIVDGKETDEDVMRSMDPNTIANVEVLKGEKAIAEYGEKGKNGVVKITTRKSGSAMTIPAPPALPDINTIDWATTAVSINGKRVSEKELNNLDAKTIEEMEVLKGEQAQEKYGKPNAILITTKQQ